MAYVRKYVRRATTYGRNYRKPVYRRRTFPMRRPVAVRSYKKRPKRFRK